MYTNNNKNAKSNEVNKVSISFVEPFFMWNRDHTENLQLVIE